VLYKYKYSYYVSGIRVG